MFVDQIVPQTKKRRPQRVPSLVGFDPKTPQQEARIQWTRRHRFRGYRDDHGRYGRGRPAAGTAGVRSGFQGLWVGP